MRLPRRKCYSVLKGSRTIGAFAHEEKGSRLIVKELSQYAKVLRLMDQMRNVQPVEG